MTEGETALYTDEDQNAGGHRIWLKRGQIIEVNCKDVVVNVTEKVAVNAQTGCDIDGGAGNLGGVVTEKSGCPFIGANHIDFSSDVKASK